jgi:uncharacterized membrane protein YfcA
MAAVLIGVCLGLIGGGGSILTIPVLVYLFHLGPQPATCYSLFIVCVSSFVGSISYLKHNFVCYKSVVVFGIPSLISVYITRKFIFPSIPENLEMTQGFFMNKDVLIMILFSLVMMAAAFSMIRKPKVMKPDDYVNTDPYKYVMTVAGGIFVGFLSGLLGTGGGFLIIPALVIFARLGMKVAIGTSLIIITTNTAIGFLSDLHNNELGHGINWMFLAVFTALSVAGIFSGTYISRHISGYKLKTAFGWFILVIGTFIISQYFF